MMVLGYFTWPNKMLYAPGVCESALTRGASDVHGFKISALDDSQSQTASRGKVAEGVHNFPQIHTLLQRSTYITLQNTEVHNILLRQITTVKQKHTTDDNCLQVI